MDAPYQTLANPLLEGVAGINDRAAPTDLYAAQAGFDVVSADNHWMVTEDVFFENFPSHLKESAPRIWHEGYWRIGKRDGRQVWSADPAILNAVLKSNLQSAWSHETRRAHLAAEGVSAEIIFPQSLLGYYDPNPEVRAWIAGVYNDYLAEQGRKNPTFFGMGLFSNWWEAAEVEPAMRQIVDLGLKGFLVPLTLRNGSNEEISYADPAMDRFWAVAAEAGLPVCFHIGEPLKPGTRGALATGTLVAMAPFRRPISQIVFGGVLDRHPNLQIVFAEGGIGWALPWLQDAESMFDVYSEIVERPSHRPSHYWRQNLSATFQIDDLGLSHLDVLGADRVMWAQDYPHTEGTFGLSALVMKSIVDRVGSVDAKLILGGNARRIFALN
jgi:predicted TIM-barrel fold metal-dependent hydrolase